MTKYFGEVLTAMVTPFLENGDVNYDKAAELARHLADNGSDGILLAGTTGESPALSEEEKLRLFRTVAAAIKGKAKVIAGTGTYNTQQSVLFTRKAQECGVDGVMAVVPYYNKPTQEGLYRHFTAIAAATNLPVMLYNVPGRTAANMSAETTLRLAEIDNISAIKEASGDLEQISRIKCGAPAGFTIYSGDDSLTLPILAVGGEGVVSVASHLVGREIKDMIRAYKAGRPEEALRIHLLLFSLFKILFVTTSPVPVKSAMNMLGYNLGPTRLPLVELGTEHARQIREILLSLKLTVA